MIGLALALALLAAPPLTPATVSADERASLEAGEILVHPHTPADDQGFAVLAYAVIKAPVEVVWPVVRDCDKYAEFMPRVKKSELREGTVEKGVCFTEIGMPFPFSNLWAENNSESVKVPGGGFERHWHLKQGTYLKNQGSWTIYPWADGKSLAVYALEAAPDTAVPDAIIRRAQTSALPGAFEAIRKRVEP